MNKYIVLSSYLLFVVAVFLSALPTSSFAAGWKQVWRDDFNGAAGSRPAGWLYNTGGGNNKWGTGEIEYNTDDTKNAGLDGKGNLLITPLRDNSGNWTSARLESLREDFRPPKGGKMAMEGRIQLPDVTGDAALGYWPAFWAIGSTIRHGQQWPAIGEIDIMENVNGLNKVWGTLHCGVQPNNPCKQPVGLSANRPCVGPSCQSAFHKYRFEWDETVNPTQMRWYVDGKEFNRVTKSQIDDASWNAMTDHGYFFILDVAIGGGFPDSVAGKSTPTPSTVPGHPMVVDYIAVFYSN